MSVDLPASTCPGCQCASSGGVRTDDDEAELLLPLSCRLVQLLEDLLRGDAVLGRRRDAASGRAAARRRAARLADPQLLH